MGARGIKAQPGKFVDGEIENIENTQGTRQNMIQNKSLLINS